MARRTGIVSQEQVEKKYGNHEWFKKDRCGEAIEEYYIILSNVEQVVISKLALDKNL